MCALSHYFESEGLATTTITLLRFQAEKMRPPRALWVPFELGRPVGPPNDPAFQRQVIEAALALLARADGPVVLEDFPQEAPGEEDNPNWSSPPCDSSGDLTAEVDSLAALAAASADARGYANTGLTGLPPRTIAEFLQRVDSVNPMSSPTDRLAPIQVLRFGADDLKAYYADAATFGAEVPSSRQLWGWFWRETVAGATLLSIWTQSKLSDSQSRQGIVRSLVPELWQEDEAVMVRLA